MVTAIIAAAGSGKRMGKHINKMFIPLCSHPVLVRSVLAVLSCPEVDNLVVVAAPDEVQRVSGMLQNIVPPEKYQVVVGGSERQYSIAAALKAVPVSSEIILVHDGARPLVEPECIAGVIKAARQQGAAGVGVPVKDTIKIVDAEGYIAATPDRKSLWAVQTPQAFAATLLREAYAAAERDQFLGTDDASLVERLGKKVKMVSGSYRNLKMTTGEDILIAEALLGQREDEGVLCVGNGYDVHRLVTGRKLILGGVDIPYHLGLLGHSDADVLLHAIMDALLGAAGLGDIGRHFPDSDPQYKGASSLVLLAAARDKLAQAGCCSINNIDATVVAEKPKLAPYIPLMKDHIAHILGMAAQFINIKATTTEGLGFAGQGEGIAAYAVATVVRH